MVVIFAETGLLAGFFLPGDSLLFAAGVMAAAGVIHLPFWLIAAGLFAAASRRPGGLPDRAALRAPGDINQALRFVLDL